MITLSEKQIQKLIPASSSSVSKMVVGDWFVLQRQEEYNIYEIKKIKYKNINEKKLIVLLHNITLGNIVEDVNLYNVIFKERYVYYNSFIKKINKIMQL